MQHKTNHIEKFDHHIIMLMLTTELIPCSYLSLQIGGTYARPVIIPPEVAIGALGKIQVK